jgi:hypothetical protein
MIPLLYPTGTSYLPHFVWPQKTPRIGQLSLTSCHPSALRNHAHLRSIRLNWERTADLLIWTNRLHGNAFAAPAVLPSVIISAERYS